jgi:MFS family permease
MACNLNEISCAFTFLTNYAIGGLAPAFYILSIEFDKSMTETSHLLLWPILVLGLFNFFWVPLANYFGKRPIFVFASLLLCVCYIWGAVATSFKSLLWSNIIAAFAGSSTEALGAAIVNVSSPLPGSRDSRSRDGRGMLVW